MAGIHFLHRTENLLALIVEIGEQVHKIPVAGQEQARRNNLDWSLACHTHCLDMREKLDPVCQVCHRNFPVHKADLIAPLALTVLTVLVARIAGIGLVYRYPDSTIEAERNSSYRNIMSWLDGAEHRKRAAVVLRNRFVGQRIVQIAQIVPTASLKTDSARKQSVLVVLVPAQEQAFPRFYSAKMTVD